MKYQIEVYLPSQNAWLNFKEPFNKKDDADDFLYKSLVVAISKDFEFRVVGIH